jgi:predicted DNA-binding antitoxin AbrB/MazE fold protein
MLTFEALIDEAGNIKPLQPVLIPNSRRAIVIVLDEPAENIAETALLSEKSLAEDWQREEEDEAWAYLQRATS